MDKIAKELQQLVDTNEMAGGVLIVRKEGTKFIGTNGDTWISPPRNQQNTIPCILCVL